jgi:hypothetical protein
MKYLSAVLLAGLMTAVSARAQVSVEVVLEQDKFLPGEVFNAGIRVVNRSGQTLRLGEESDWAQFSIERVGGGAVHQEKEPPLKGGFDLPSTERATVKVDLEPCFDLRRPGTYLITGSVKLKNWSKVVTSKPERFEVVEGTRLWEQEFGVPQPPGSTQVPEMRKYALQQANYLKSQLRLYLRVSAADGRVIKLINAGPMISFSHPDPKLDRESKLHLLYQSNAKGFTYLVVTPDGEIITRQTHEYTDTRPRLQWNEAGRIEVTGGIRKLMTDDIPPLVNPLNEAKEPKP